MIFGIPGIFGNFGKGPSGRQSQAFSDPLAFSLRLRFSIVPPSDASPISVKLLALSVDIILGKKNVTAVSANGPWGRQHNRQTRTWGWVREKGEQPVFLWLCGVRAAAPRGLCSSVFKLPGSPRGSSKGVTHQLFNVTPSPRGGSFVQFRREGRGSAPARGGCVRTWRAG